MFVLAWGGAAGFRFGRMPLDKSAALEPVDQKTGSTIRTGKLVVNLDTRVVSGAVTGCSDLYMGTAALSERDYVHEAINGADLILSIGHDTARSRPSSWATMGPK